MEEQKKRTWAEISLQALAHNYAALREMLPAQCRFMGMVKSNAYGHGALPVARKLEELGADYLGVACLDEALELREGGITMPILILGGTDVCYVPELLKYNLTQTVFELETARAFSDAADRAGACLTIHIKADTGMSRLGFLCHESQLERAAEEIAAVCRLPALRAEGIFTHFSDADGDEQYTMCQFERFLAILEQLEQGGVAFPIRHCANSAATLSYPSFHLDMVRPGIALYGHYPVPELEPLCDLEPVMTVFSRVIAVRTVPAQTAVSYGQTAVVERETRLAVLPIGYGDGFFRACSNRATVLLHGQAVRVVGRVCMDLCMLDVTECPEVQVGDIATVYGAEHPIENTAELIPTISYELLCALSGRVPRVY